MTRDQVRDHIKSIVDGWPPLTDERRALLRELFRPVPAPTRRAA